MSSRFTDTRIWYKPWFTSLSPTEKTAWFYIKDVCDNVGVYDRNDMLEKIYIGDGIDWEEFRKKCNGNIVVIEGGKKWWLVDFCDFQYQKLSEDSISRPILSYIRDLKKHGLWDRYLAHADGINDDESIPYTNPLDSVQDKDKEQEKDKEKEEGEKAPKRKSIKKQEEPKMVYGDSGLVSLTNEEYDNLVDTYGEENTKKIIDKLDSYKLANGKKYKSDAGAMRNWVIDSLNIKPKPSQQAKLSAVQVPKQRPGVYFNHAVSCPICGIKILPQEMSCRGCGKPCGDFEDSFIGAELAKDAHK